jgi:hypothetical protein
MMGLFMLWFGNGPCWMYDVGGRGRLLADVLVGCRWVLGGDIRKVGSWPYGLVWEMVFWCVIYELIRS